jgi:Cu/Ag efflux pump CusA
MPPPAVTEVAVAQLVPLLVVLLLLLLLLLELDELQAAVSTTPLATAAVAAITCLARTISLPSTVPGIRDARSQILARQVEIMTSQDKREVSSP